MAGTTGITITGSDQVVKNLNNLGPEAQKIIKAAMQKSADAVKTHAQRICPVDTGFLRSEIRVDSVSETKAEITSHAEYSIYQKDDFMGDAFASEVPNFVQEMQKAYVAAWQSAQ